MQRISQSVLSILQWTVAFCQVSDPRGVLNDNPLVDMTRPLFIDVAVEYEAILGKVHASTLRWLKSSAGARSVRIEICCHLVGKKNRSGEEAEQGALLAM